MGNGNTVKEPNGKGPPPDQCVVANYTQAWADNSSMASNVSAFGWADTKCNAQYPIMCRKNRGWPAPAAPAAALLRACSLDRPSRCSACRHDLAHTPPRSARHLPLLLPRQRL